MPKSQAFPGIEADFPDLGDVPANAEILIVANDKDYNVTPAQLAVLGGALDGDEIVEAINDALGTDDWQSGAGGGGGLDNLLEDTSPQLGGNLDLNSFTVGDATAADLTKLHALTATSTELNYVDGVTSALQTQIDAKVTGPASATADTLARFDGTTGKLLKDGLAFLDEDDLASDSATSVPSQQSVKAYVDGLVVDNIDAALAALPDGTIWTTHGGADETLVPAVRDGVGTAAAQLNEGAFLAVEAEPAPTTETGGTYTIQPEDFGKHIHLTDATPEVLVDAQATETYPDGFWCSVSSANDFEVDFQTAVDGNGEAASGWDCTAYPGSIVLIRLASDDWLILGSATVQA